MTRRGALALFGAATALSAQTPQKTVPPQGVPQPQTSLEKAVAGVKQTSGQLRQIEVSMTLEPAFSFRA